MPELGVGQEVDTTPTPTEWVVFCETHGHYLVRASAGGTTWSDDRDAARRYRTKPEARTAATSATWLDHRPVPWAVAAAPAPS